MAEDWRTRLLLEDADRNREARRQDEEARAAALRMQQVETSPDRAAQIGTLARQTGLSPPDVEASLTQLRGALESRGIDWRNVPQPVLSVASDPVTATVVRDDIEQMSGLARVLAYGSHGVRQAQAMNDRATLGMIRRQRELTMAERRQLESVNSTLAEQLDGDNWFSAFGVNIPSTMANVTTQMGLALPDVVEGAAAGMATGGAIGAGAGLAAGGVGALPGAAAGGLLGLKVGAGAGMLRHSWQIEAGNAYMDLLDEGHEADAAWLAANVYGAAAASLDLIGAGRAVSPIVRQAHRRLLGEATRDLFNQRTQGWAIREAAKELGQVAAIEGGTEAMQAALQQATYAVMRGRDPAKFDQASAEEIIRSIALEGFAGVIGGTTLGGVGATLQYANDMRAVRQAKDNANFLTSLGTSAEAVKLRERMPDEMASFVERAAGEGLETIGIDANQFVAYWQSQGEDAREAADQLGVLDQLDQAIALGGDLVVPLGTAVSKLAGSPHYAGLVPDMRIGSGMTLRETEATLEQADSKQEEWQKAIDDALADDTLREEIITHFDKQLEVSDLPPRVRKAQATLAALGIVNIARAAGVDPRAYWASWQVEVARAMAPESTDQMQGEVATTSRTPTPRVIDTPEFKAFFGESKVVDRDGAPRVVYRGRSPGSGNVLRSSVPYFSLTDRGARTYAEEYQDGFEEDEDGNDITPDPNDSVLAAYVSIQNVADEAAITRVAEAAGITLQDPELPAAYLDANPDLVAALKAAGYDGVEGSDIDMEGDLIDIVAPFSSEQVKAVGNRGTFDPNDPNILNQDALGEAKAIAVDATWKTNRDFKLALQEQAHAAAKAAGVSLERDSPALRDWILAQAVNDLQAAVVENSGAVGWYGRTVNEMWAIIGLIHPEVLEPGPERFHLQAAIAITSNGMKVNRNLPLALDVYEAYQASGVGTDRRFPTDKGEGAAAGAINASLGLVNDLVADLGWETVSRFFMTEMTVGDLARAGVKISGENMDQAVVGAAVLGPKIGNGFYANLAGKFDSLTMDRWYMRTFNRWRGRLVTLDEKAVKTTGDRLSAAIRAARGDKDAWATLNALAKKRVVLGDIRSSAQALRALSQSKAWRTAFDAVAGGAEIRRAANNMAKAMDGQNEAPFNGGDRSMIRGLMNTAITLASNFAPGLVMADMQALYWYMEQRLYALAKAKRGVVPPPIDPDKEPNYANVAADVARARGIDEGSISNARDAGRRSAGDGGRRGRPAGRGAGGGFETAGALDPGERAQALDRLKRFAAALSRAAASEADVVEEPRSAYGMSVAEETRKEPRQRAARARAIKAVASLEAVQGQWSMLANVVSSQFKEQGFVSLLGQKVESTADLAVLVQQYRDPRFETFRLYFVDANDRIVYQTGTTQRLPGSAMVAPSGVDMDDYFTQIGQAAKAAGAERFWMSHNHPSGNPSPSNADIYITRAIERVLSGTANLTFEGHIVTDSTKFAEITPDLDAPIWSLPSRLTPSYREGDAPTVPHPLLGRTAPLNPVDIAAYAKEANGLRMPVLIGRRGTTGAVSMIAELDLNTFATPEALQAVIEEAVRASGSADAFMVGVRPKHHRLVKKVYRNGWLRDVMLTDDAGTQTRSVEFSGVPGWSAGFGADVRAPSVEVREDPAPYTPGQVAPEIEVDAKDPAAVLEFYQGDPLWYSRLHKAVEAHPRGKGTPEEWRRELAAMAKKGLLAESEMRAVGIEDFFGMFEDDQTISRERLVAWLGNNGVKLTERVYGAAGTEPQYVGDRIYNILPIVAHNRLGSLLMRAGINVADGASIDEESDRVVVLLADEFSEREDGTEVMQYLKHEAIPELVRENVEYQAALAVWTRSEDNATAYHHYATPGLEDYVELTVRLEDDAHSFASSHWRDTNVVVHFRGGTLKDQFGNETFLIDEIQSDWGQFVRSQAGQTNGQLQFALEEAERARGLREQAEARAAGVQADPIATPEELALAFSPAFADGPDGQVQVMFGLRELGGRGARALLADGTVAYWPRSMYDDVWAAMARLELPPAYSAEQAVLLQRVWEARKREELAKVRVATEEAMLRPPPPMVEKTEAWVRLALRRILRYAVDNGHTSVTITPAIFQAFRYGRMGESNERIKGMTTFYETVVPNELRKLAKQLGGVIARDGQTVPMQWSGVRVERAVPLAIEDASDDFGDSRFGVVFEDAEGNIIDEPDEIDESPFSASTDEATQAMAERVNAELNTPALTLRITPAMREAFAKAQPLMQGKGDKPRGAYAFVGYRKALIKMFEAHDESTFLHEAAGHLFLEMLRDLWATAGDARTEDFLRDVATIEQWLGVSMAGITREQHEQFARGMELYLREGKAPSESLRSLFSRAAQWLQRVYLQEKELRVELTPEVRAAFDRIFATREQVEAQARALHMRPLFEMADAAGMTEAEFRKYRQAAQKAIDVAKAGLLSEYETAERKKVSDAAKARRQALLPQVTAEVAARPEVRLSTYLRTGKLPLDQAMPEGWKSRKIDREELQETLDGYLRTGASPVQGSFAMSDFDGVTQAKGGHSLEELQALFGMADVDEVLAAAQYTASLKEAIEAELEARIDSEFGDTLSPEFARRAAERKLAENGVEVLEIELRALRRLEALNNAAARRMQEAGAPPANITRGAAEDARRDAVEAVRGDGIDAAQPEVLAAAAADAEARAAVGQRRAQGAARRTVEQLQRDARPRLDDLARLRTMARNMVREMPIERILRRGVFTQAAARAAVQAERAIAERAYDAAALAKRQQILNLEMLRAANEIAEQVRKDLKFAKSLEKPTTRKKIDADYLDLIDDVLSQYAFFRVSDRMLRNWASRAAWYKAQVESGVVPNIDPALIEDVTRKPYHKLTADQFDAVIDNLHLLEHQGRTKNDLRIAGKKRKLDQVAIGVAQSILEHAGKFEQTIGGDSFSERSRALKSYLSSTFFRPFAIIRALDGGREGAAYEAIKRPIDDAVNNGLIPRQAEAAKALDDLYARHYTQSQLRRMERKNLKQAKLGKLSRAQVLSLALNWGNADNRKAVLEGRIMKARGVTEADVLEAINLLEANDIAFIRDAWSLIDSYWPEIFRLHRERTGERLKKVEASPLVTRHGVLAGGYYPLSYNGLTSVKVSEELVNAAFQQLAAGRFSKAQTSRGHTIERVGSGGRDVRLDLNVMHSHVDKVVRDLVLGEAVTGVYKVLNHPVVRAAFVDGGLVDVHRALDLWIKDTAAGEIMFNNQAERLVRHLRTGFTLSRLGFNFGSAAIQPTGLAQTIAVLGATDTLRGFRRVFANLFTMSEITQATPFMRERLGTMNKDMNDSIAAMRGTGWRSDFTKAAYWMMSRTQLMVDAVTWAAAYERGTREHPLDDVEARAYADRAVARAQSTSLFHERSALERGTLSENVRQTEFIRLWTVLASYMINKASNAYDITVRTQFSNPVSALKWAMDLSMLFIVEGILVAAIRGQLPDEEDDEGESWPLFITRTTAEQVLGSFPFLREIPSLMKGFDGGGSGGAFLGQVADALQQTGAAIEDPEEQLDVQLVKSINNVGGTVFHYPAAAINRMISAFNRELEGEDVPLIEYFMAQGNPK
jgi:hypothetical protein